MNAIRFLMLIAPTFLFGCAGMEKVNYTRLEAPLSLEATRNYLPKDVAIQSAYTIYEGSQWTCNYKTEAGDYICCQDRTISMGTWKYCLLVDEQKNGFAFMELGTNEFLRWSEGKQSLFGPITTQLKLGTGSTEWP